MKNDLAEIKKKLSNTTKTADTTMTKIDNVQIIADIARTASVSTK